MGLIFYNLGPTRTNQTSLVSGHNLTSSFMMMVNLLIHQKLSLFNLYLTIIMDSVLLASGVILSAFESLGLIALLNLC